MLHVNESSLGFRGQLQNTSFLPELIISNLMATYCWSSRSCRGQPGVKVRRNAPRDHQIWLEESVTGA